jgi:hypothetical protein
LKRAWAGLLSTKGRSHYDPFHEIWLFSVGEELATYHESESTEPEISE